MASLDVNAVSSPLALSAFDASQAMLVRANDEKIRQGIEAAAKRDVLKL